MGTRVRVVSGSQSRVSINKQERDTVRVVGIIPDTSAITKLTSLSDVDASDPDNNETLVYDEAQQKYVIKTLPVVDGGTF